MTIECAILGLLCREPLAGYDLKKRMQNAPEMPWSGNNNQIYKVLSALLDEGLLESELQPQDGLPARKVYTITALGRTTLKEWLTAAPEMMELKSPFLAQLSVASIIGAQQVDVLLHQYERQLMAQLHTLPALCDSDDFDSVLRLLVQDSIKTSYESQLGWVQRARDTLRPFAQQEHTEAQNVQEHEENPAMPFDVLEKNGEKYLHYRATASCPETLIPTQFVADCVEQCVNRVMLEECALPESFFRLRTVLAGEVLQKLEQYRVRVALVLSQSGAKGKFKDLLIEANRGGRFRSFASTEQAEKWLTGEDVQ